MLSNRFRWVYCQLEALQPCFPINLRRMLEELPNSLDETYQRILKEINNANHKQAHQLLQCLAVAHRPLRVDELAEVLALDIDAGGIPTLNAKWRWEDHEAAVLSACSSLVSVIIDRGSRVVQFSHFSVKEFLMSDRLASMEDVSQFHIGNEPSHLILAQACLGVFFSMDDRTSEDSVEDIALLPYAKKYWVAHAQVGKVELCIKDALDRLLDLNKPHFEALLCRTGTDRNFQHFRAPSDSDPKGVLTPAAPFFAAGITGLSGLAERLIVPNRQQVIGFRVQRWTLLHLMVAAESMEGARLLLAHGADINSRPGYATSSHIASLQSHVERPMDSSLGEINKIENSLQRNYADVTTKENIDDDIMNDLKESGFTPLHIAASEGYLDMCLMLLEHKADVYVQDNKGNTPLHLASSRNHLEISRKLLEYNAEVNSQNEDGSTPLLIALSKGNIDCFWLLIAHNADVSARDNRGNTPLYVAAIGGHLEVVHSLLELNAEVNSRNNEGSTPFLRTSLNGNLDIVRLLLDNGADARTHDNSGNTPLHFAASGGHLEVVRILLELKVDVNSLSRKGLTPLYEVMNSPWRKGTPGIVRLLLINGADVHTRDDNGNTPLHFTASEGDLELARIILERSADVNSQNNDGLSALLLALKRGNLEVARLLLDHNADVHMRDERGNTPLHVAVSERHIDICRMLLKRNAEVNSRNHHGTTPLLLASERGPELVQLFLDHNADPHARDGDGDTLLHCAALAGRLEVVRLLLELNVEVHSRNNKGSTPLHLASAGYPSTGGNPDIVRLLLDHGADSQARNLRGLTASHVARGNKRQEIMQLLSPHTTELIDKKKYSMHI